MEITRIKKYTDEEIKEARYKLWLQGNLYWKLDPVQKRAYNFLKESKQKVSVLNISRRIGKSYLLTIIAIEFCLKNPKSIVNFLQPEQKMIKNNLSPIMDKILQDCPNEVRPVFHVNDATWKFPNGSVIRLAGTDNGNHNKLRGSDSHICMIDEAGFVKAKLSEIIQSIFIPSTSLTKGKIILSSTTPIEQTNEFMKFMERAELNGSLFRMNIYEALEIHKTLKNPRFTEVILNEEILAAYPDGDRSEEFRREYMNELITDGSSSIIPEFTPEVQKECITQWIRPPYCDRYVAMDVGFKDLTVVLFAYYDFENAITVIEDELVINGPKMTTDLLANLIKSKEKELWTDTVTNEFIPPTIRISDNNLIVINDLARLHALYFIPTQKDNKDAAINNVRMDIAACKIIVNPKCTTLINHLKFGVWDSQRKDFKRSADGAHYDALAALSYLMRNINKNKNPFPKDYAFRQKIKGASSGFYARNSQQQVQNESIYYKMMNMKRPESLKK